MTVFLAIVGVVLVLMLVAVFVGAIGVAARRRELRRNSLSSERLENLEQFVR